MPTRLVDEYQATIPMETQSLLKCAYCGYPSIGFIDSQPCAECGNVYYASTVVFQIRREIRYFHYLLSYSAPVLFLIIVATIIPENSPIPIWASVPAAALIAISAMSTLLRPTIWRFSEALVLTPIGIGLVKKRVYSELVTWKTVRRITARRFLDALVISGTHGEIGIPGWFRPKGMDIGRFRINVVAYWVEFGPYCANGVEKVS